MALSSNTMRGLIRYFAGTKRKGLATPRIVVWPDDTTPVYSAVHLRPVTTPSGTAAEGDISWNATNNAPEFYTGDSWQTIPGSSSYAATATADGTGTGTIPAGVGFVTVTSGDANHIVTLPAPVVGRRVVLRNAGTGYELRSSAPATVAINGGTGASAESAIGANVLVTCVCGTATTWVCMNQSTNGTVSATEAAA